MNPQENKPMDEMERGVYTALTTYSNVHRGSGHHSQVSTRLFEQAKKIVLEYQGLNPQKYRVIFCSPRSVKPIAAQFPAGSFQILDGKNMSLPLGVCAISVKKKALPGGAPRRAGGGTARLVSPGWVVWEKTANKFEPGTPSLVNIVAFAKTLKLANKDQTPVRRFSEAQRAVGGFFDWAPHPGSEGLELLEHLRKTRIGGGLAVPTRGGAKPYIHLDHGASTPTFEPIWHAARDSWKLSETERPNLISQTKKVCADFLSAPPEKYEVLFTTNATESIHLVAESLEKKCRPDSQTVVLNTLLEHNSNELAWRASPQVTVLHAPVDPEGFIDLAAMEASLKEYNQDCRHGAKRIRLVAASGASNVLGTCNDMAAVGCLAHQYGAEFLVDGAQLVAHRKVDLDAWGVDYFAFSAHKVYAPFGTGVLVARKGHLAFDATEMREISASGESNIGGIASLGASLSILDRIGMDLIEAEERKLTKRAMVGLSQIEGISMYGMQDAECPRFQNKLGVIPFNLKGFLSGRVARELAERGGIGVRHGCHCAHLLIKRMLGISPGLERFQGVIVSLFPRLELPGVVRVSFGLENREGDVDALLGVLKELAGGINVKKAHPVAMGPYIEEAAMAVYS